MINLIGISGKQNSGKDTVGKIIQYLDWKNKIEKGESKSLHYTIEDFLNGNIIFVTDWEIRKFADKLKDMVCLLIGCTREQLEDREFKNTPLGKQWTVYECESEIFATEKEAQYRLNDILGEKSWEAPVNTIQLTPRELLQLLGTDCGRDIIHPDIWCNALFADWQIKNVVDDWNKPKGKRLINQKVPNWIITDVRFPNEVQAIKDRGGIVIRINRENYKNTGNHPSEISLDDYCEWDYVIDNNGSISDLIKQVETIYER